MSEVFKNSYTFRLFKKEPSFTDGFASLIDMTPNVDRYHQDITPEEADTNALQSDWKSIGNDLYKTIKKYESKQPKQVPVA